ncbi:MAG TPA: DUF5615 family PIN-like protein [Candidatus Dormibacteraeota bacterium]|nr:DUF5615 family PIN-like protein [Candidatus Dormibacteraeota bacterium]
MRLLLDEHLSSKAVVDPLRQNGHDVLAVCENADLRGLTDELLFEVAVGEERVMTTSNIGDFARITALWTGEGRHHCGCVLLPGIDHSEFGVLLRTLLGALRRWPRGDDWRDSVRYLSRGT